MEQNTIPAQTRFETNAIYDYPCEEESPVLNLIENEGERLEVFPNPAHETIHIKTDIEGTINIWDFNGRLIENIKVQIGLNKIDVRSYPRGVYHLNLKNLRKEIIKQVSFVLE